MGEILAFVVRNYVAPKGVNFARYSIDYHILRNYLHVLDAWGEERAQTSMPLFAQEIVQHYLNHQDNDTTMMKLKSQILHKKQKNQSHKKKSSKK